MTETLQTLIHKQQSYLFTQGENHEIIQQIWQFKRMLEFN